MAKKRQGSAGGKPPAGSNNLVNGKPAAAEVDAPDAKRDAIPRPSTDIPETRQHASVAPARPSASALSAAAPLTYPDDGAFAGTVRKVDHWIGLGEQALLFAVLAAVVIVAASSAIADKVFGSPIGRWWHYIVRGGTFVIALLGAAFATYQQRHLAMDLVSRSLSRRSRLVLGLALKAFTIVVAGVLFHTGMHLRETASGIDKEHLELLGLTITDKDIVAAIPFGALLISLHSLLHLLIDVEYLVRNKLPPERERSGH